MFYSIVNQTETNCIGTFLYILNIDIGKVTTGNMTGYIVDWDILVVFFTFFDRNVKTIFFFELWKRSWYILW